MIIKFDYFSLARVEFGLLIGRRAMMNRRGGANFGQTASDTHTHNGGLRTGRLSEAPERDKQC